LWSQVIDSLAADLDDEELESAVRGAARPVAHLSDVVTQRIGQPLPLTGDDAQALRFRLYEAVAVFIDRATRGEPTVITLDDIQWADVPSLELLSYLTSSLVARPMLIAAAYRDLQADRSAELEATLAAVAREADTGELQIRGLDHEAVAALAGELLDDPDAVERTRFVTELHERTAGNPFFVRQLARLISETGSRSADSTSVPAPAGVNHVISSRLRALSPATLELIDAAAVTGREFDVRTAASAAGIDVAAALVACDEAARAGLVERPEANGGHLRFAHALVHEVVLEQLPPGRAAMLHARVAAQLQLLADPPVEQLAEHYWAARDVVGASAVSAQLAAADASAAVFAHESAEVHLRRALHLLESAQVVDSEAEITVLLRLFRLVATVRVWGDADAHQLVARAMRLVAGSPITDGTVRLWWSVFFFLFDRGDERACGDLARTLLASLDQADAAFPPTSAPQPNRAARAAIHIMNIFPQLATDDRDAARRHLERAKQYAEAADPVDLAAYDENLHVMVLAVEARWAALTGDLETHGSCVSAAIGLADADGRPFARAFARSLGASSAPQVALPADVRDLAADALEVSTRFGYQWLAGMARVVLEWAEAHLHGAAASPASNIESTLTYLADHGRHGSDFWLRLLLSDLYLLDGRDQDAREVFEAVRDNPGFYGRLVVDYVEGKLHQLA